MNFVGPPPGQRPLQGSGVLPRTPEVEPVPGFRRVRPLTRDGVAVTDLAENRTGRLAVLTVGITPLPHGIRIGYLDWLERLAGISGHGYVADVLAGGVTAEHRPYLAVAAGVATLAGRLRDSGSAPAEVVRSLGCGLAEALGLAHDRALLHGTVRPTVVVVDEAGMARLAGFDNAAPGMERPPLPSPYSAPELLPRIGAGQPAASTAGDVYGLAATLYVMAGGRLPWASDGPAPGDPGRALPEVELEDMAGVVARAVHRGLLPDPDRRIGLGALREQLVTATLTGVERPGRPVAEALLRDDGIRPVLAADAAEAAEPAATEPAATEPAATEPAREEPEPTVVAAPRSAAGPGKDSPDATGRRGGRLVAVAAGLAVAFVAVAVVMGFGGGFGVRPDASHSPDRVTGEQPLQNTPSATLSLGPGKAVAPPSSPAASPSRSASVTPSTESPTSPAAPTETSDPGVGVEALAGRWRELRPWQSEQAILRFSHSGQMSMSGPASCSGQAQPDGSGQRSYELVHNCDKSGHAVVVLSGDGQTLTVYWRQNRSDQYARD